MTEQNKITTLLKKPEILRDEAGRFEQHGRSIKKSQKINPDKIDGRLRNGGSREGAGRPKGVKNKIPLALKEAILRALDKLGGDEYLVTLGIENSSAFAGLLGKVLPTTLQASDKDNGPAVIRFERVIVMPDGTKHIEGKTPKQLPAPKTGAWSDSLTRSAVDEPTNPTADEPDAEPTRN